MRKAESTIYEGSEDMTLARSKAEPGLARRESRPVAWNEGGAGDIVVRAEELRLAEAAGWETQARRLLLVWFRIHVLEREDGKWKGVNIRIPLPIPLLGGLLRRKLTQRQAMKALAMAYQDAEGLVALNRYLDSTMAMELIRVEESGDEDEDGTLVVIGFD